VRIGKGDPSYFLASEEREEEEGASP